MGNKFREVTTTTNDSELDKRNNLDHIRVIDPELNALVKILINKIDKIESHLRYVTELETD